MRQESRSFIKKKQPMARVVSAAAVFLVDASQFYRVLL
jgi:hypothetical protein